MTKRCPVCPCSPIIVAHPGIHFLPLFTMEYFLDWMNYVRLYVMTNHCLHTVPPWINFITSFIFPALDSVYLCLCALYLTQRPNFPSLTVSALLLWQWRRAGGDIRILAGNILGDENAPIRLGHGWDGGEKGEWWRGMPLIFWQVVILGRIAFIKHPGSHIGEGRCLGAASLLLGEGRGRADAGRV